MKLSKLITVLQNIHTLYGDLSVSIMQEVDVETSGALQVESVVKDVAVVVNDRVIIIGDEL